MRKITLFAATTMAATLFTACAPAGNAPAGNANTNTNAAKPVAAAPTVDALLAMDKQANEAWIKGDAKFFEGFLSDKFVSTEGGMRMSKAELLAMMGSFKCDVKSWSLDDPQMATIDADTYVLSYKGTFDGSCSGPDGKSMKLPSPVRGASVYVRNGEKWQGVFHGENLIIDPTAPPAPPTVAKKDEAKKDDMAASNSNANTAASKPIAPATSPNTEALVKLHNAGWEAFKNKDAKKLEEATTKNLSFIGPDGTWLSGQSNVVKLWTETLKCEGITKTSFTEGVATALSPTVEILTGKGTADGTCGGQKNGDLYQTAVYVKEGDAWKLAFMMDALPMSGM